MRAEGGLDRIAEFAQPVHISPDGARADLEACGQLTAGPFAGRLQERKQPEQAGGGVTHMFMMPRDIGPIVA